MLCCHSSCSVSWSCSSNTPLICLSSSLGCIHFHKAALSISLMTLTNATTMNNTPLSRHTILRLQIVSSHFDNMTAKPLISISTLSFHAVSFLQKNHVLNYKRQICKNYFSNLNCCKSPTGVINRRATFSSFCYRGGNDKSPLNIKGSTLTNK